MAEPLFTSETIHYRKSVLNIRFSLFKFRAERIFKLKVEKIRFFIHFLQISVGNSGHFIDTKILIPVKKTLCVTLRFLRNPPV